MDETRICVGAIAGSFGVKGEVRLKSFCADPAAIVTYAPLFTDANPDGYTLTINRTVKNGFAARLSGVKTKEDADALRGTELYADRNKLPGLPDDEYYHSDLIGLLALDTGGDERGHVKDVQNHGAGDLLEIQLPKSAETVLVPFTLKTVPTVDLATRRVIIDPPEGLFPDA